MGTVCLLGGGAQIQTWKDKQKPKEIGRTAVALSPPLCCEPQTSTHFISSRMGAASLALEDTWEWCCLYCDPHWMHLKPPGLHRRALVAN